MAKEVTNAVKFRDPIQPVVGPDRELFVLACDDGSIYEFQKHTDSKIWNLRRRGERSNHPQDWTQRRAPLPSDVIEILDETLGEKKWTK
jgi:hypothetical protein